MTLTLLTTMILAAALAGCLQQSDDLEDDGSPPGQSNSPTGTHFNPSSENKASSESAADPEPTRETGSITGQVVDDSYTPIHGGLVSLTNNTGTVTETFTDEQGKYTINDIKPGEYGLRFTAECCAEHVERLRIQADRITTTSPILVAWRGHEPYVHPDKWSGFICADGPPFISYCGLVDQNHAMNYRFDIHRGIKTMVVAMDTEDGFNMKDCLHLQLRIYPFQNPGTDTGDIWSSESCQSLPIEFRVDAGDMDPNRDFNNFTVQDINMQFRVSAEGGGLPTNVVYQQTFTVHWEEYYWEHAPEGASALPDS